jgi:hypothetical protein
MKKDQTPIKRFCRWRLFHPLRGPWHFAYHRPTIDPPPTNPPPPRYKTWRALCGTQFMLNADQERDSPPQENVCQRCLQLAA